MAARAIAQTSVRSVAVSQLWAFGDRFYFGPKIRIEDVGTPPHEIPAVDALAFYESDIRDPAAITSRGYRQRWRFDDGPARAVVVYIRSP
jgi:hypothetical protein